MQSPSLRLHLARLAPSHQRCLARSISTSSARRATTDSPKPVEDDGVKPAAHKGVSFDAWMIKIGDLFKNPKAGKTNWLGGDHPFPMNPTFKPRPPISDSLRQYVFDAHISDPETNSIRALSERFGISINRIQAMVRLKALELRWKQEGRTLRTNFNAGMESALGVKQQDVAAFEAVEVSKSDSTLADYVAETDANTVTEVQRGIPKMYWEGIEDGKEPLVAPLLASFADQHAQKTADRMAANAKFLATHQHVVAPSKEGRAPIVFVDVGTKFLVRKELKQREKAAETRKKQRQKQQIKRAEKSRDQQRSLLAAA